MCDLNGDARVGKIGREPLDTSNERVTEIRFQRSEFAFLRYLTKLLYFFA